MAYFPPGYFEDGYFDAKQWQIGASFGAFPAILWELGNVEGRPLEILETGNTQNLYIRNATLQESGEPATGATAEVTMYNLSGVELEGAEWPIEYAEEGGVYMAVIPAEVERPAGSGVRVEIIFEHEGGQGRYNAVEIVRKRGSA